MDFTLKAVKARIQAVDQAMDERGENSEQAKRAKRIIFWTAVALVGLPLLVWFVLSI